MAGDNVMCLITAAKLHMICYLSRSANENSCSGLEEMGWKRYSVQCGILYGVCCRHAIVVSQAGFREGVILVIIF